MTTAKRIAAGVLAAATLLVVTGCGNGQGIFGEIYTVAVEVTGTGTQATEVTYHLPADGGTERDVPLPWKKETRSEFLPVKITAKPAAGATVTCRIVVNGKEVTTVTSLPGAPAECSKEKVD
jgi:hypothetical protein